MSSQVKFSVHSGASGVDPLPAGALDLSELLGRRFRITDNGEMSLLILSGAILYAFAALFGKNFSSLAPVVTATCTVLWAVVFVVPLAILLEQPWTIQPSTQSLLAAIAMTLFSTVLAFLIYFRLLKTLGAMGTASQAYLRAGVSVLLGILLLGESLTPTVTLGVILAILGVVAINFPKRS